MRLRVEMKKANNELNENIVSLLVRLRVEISIKESSGYKRYCQPPREAAS